MDLNKYIVKNDDTKPFHSSGFAKIASGDRLGSTASISFEQRQRIERDRRFVGSYQRSAIGQSKIQLPARRTIRLKPVNAPLGRQSRSPQIRAAKLPIRHYDPFA